MAESKGPGMPAVPARSGVSKRDQREGPTREEMHALLVRISDLEGAMRAVVEATTVALASVDPTGEGATRIFHDQLEEYGYGAFASLSTTGQEGESDG